MHFILYVRDAETSVRFWSNALAIAPALHVPGMTEFHLADGVILGLMPAAGIKRLLGDPLPDPQEVLETPRAEVYLVVADPFAAHARALAAGARELSEVQQRDWGHVAGYALTPDGHVLAFAGT